MTIHAIQPDFYDDAKEHAAVLDGVVCTNKLACELVKVDSGVNEKRIFYAPYGVTVHTKTNTSKEFQEPFRLAYVGRLEQHQKLVHDLPPILEHLEAAGFKYQLIIAGTGPEETWIKREFKDRMNVGIVEFLGAIELHEMNKNVYDRADAVIITSAWETGPIIAWEAMASGVPVVTSQYIGSGLENSLTNNKNCLTFPVGDSREAAECIMRLKDVHVREKLVRGGYQVVNNRYDQQSSVEAWDRSFVKIMASQINSEAVKQSFTVTPSGRLDRVLGIGLGETIRSAFSRRYVHQSAGSEWPHSYGTRNLHDSSFWSMAKSLDEAATKGSS
jgi:glycosyltransferase involved in cell wall biosynthesis